MKQKTTWSAFWGSIEDTARKSGAVDVDLVALANSTRNLLISAGWCGVDNTVVFSSENDRANAVAAATDHVKDQTPIVVGGRIRQNRVIRAGYELSPSQAKDHATLSASNFMPVENTAAVSPLPGLADTGSKCPRCEGSMVVVGLVNDKAAVYCLKDRIALPL